MFSLANVQFFWGMRVCLATTKEFSKMPHFSGLIISFAT